MKRFSDVDLAPRFRPLPPKPSHSLIAAQAVWFGVGVGVGVYGALIYFALKVVF